MRLCISGWVFQTEDLLGADMDMQRVLTTGLNESSQINVHFFHSFAQGPVA